MVRRFVAVCALIAACTVPSREEGRLATLEVEVEVEVRNPWTHLELPHPSSFHFAVVSDRTGSHRPGVFASAIEKLNALQPAFVLSVGDLIEGYADGGELEDLASIEAGWNEATAMTTSLEMPFFYVVGNNDISSDAMKPAWSERFGRLYYSFRYRNVLFVALSSEDPPKSRWGQISDEQIEWLRRTLEDSGDVRWTFLFLHRPMWLYEEEEAWSRVEAVLGERPRTVFAGHHHSFGRTEIGGFEYFNLATTGGGSRMRGRLEGEFDHVTWVTMTSAGPRIAQLMLDGIWGADPTVE